MVQMFMRDLKKVSALWSVRFRVSALERLCYKGFLRNSSGTKFFVRLRKASALEHVRLREVPLYFTPFFSVPTVNFEQINLCWVPPYQFINAEITYCCNC